MLKSVFTILATSALLAACTEAKVEQIASPSNPYPGNPDENFAPVLVRDGSYKNLALNRMAYASSSWDYSLTAQLATDGMVEEKQPAHIVLSTQEGLVPKMRTSTGKVVRMAITRLSVTCLLLNWMLRHPSRRVRPARVQLL